MSAGQNPHPAPVPRIRLGQLGEDAAAAIMRRHGYEVIARNWRFGHLELDLVCQRGELLVFVEVKTRKGRSLGGAASALTGAKQKKLLRAAQAFLQLSGGWLRPCRFDLVCLTGRPDNFSLEYYPDAFQFSWPQDSGNAPGQCW